ncbi:MAG: ATP-binding cassette domain-containing protein [Hyphomonadaceae bacterium]|nr:ATP-binding cassette domain-containing protein [Hyphomonadaceae bacterium]
MPEPAAIALADVTKRFDGDKPALDGISLAVQPGEFLVIVGISGSGKTTLLQLINRLSEPTAGQVRIGGVNALALDPVTLRRRIGYVFQEVGLFPHMTVAENIAITPRLLGWDEQRQTARVDELLCLVRLDPGYRARFPHQLSGGERQRVGVARALAAGPDVVLMDEPFAALDPLTRDGLAQDYRRLHDALRLTTVMITHDVLEALGVADRIAVLQAGRIIAEGTPSALMLHQHADVRELMLTPRKIADRVGALLAGKER